MSDPAWTLRAKPIGAKALGALASSLLDPIARARGFATSALLTEWASIVGAELAAFTRPHRIAWPRQVEEGERQTGGWRTEGAILTLKVDGPRAIEVQHRLDQILERVNLYFGYRAVSQVRFLQSPLARPERPQAASRIPQATLPLPQSASISDPELAKALGRLGASVLAKSERD